MTFQAIEIGADAADRHGALVLDGGELVAVVARLDDLAQGGLVGRWAMEATFGRLAEYNALGITFPDCEAIEQWVGATLAGTPQPPPRTR